MKFNVNNEPANPLTPSDAFLLGQILSRLEALAASGHRLAVMRWCLWAASVLEGERA